jgi:parallel beta-helix repeat protein
MKKITIIFSIILLISIINQSMSVTSNDIIRKDEINTSITNNIFTLDQTRAFHDYNSLTTELQNISNDYPDITNLYNLGSSVLGRTIWGLKITDNPDIEENEPEVRICGAHHGNEYMSVELPLLLAWLLVENYTIDPEITDLINNREIWIIPLVNPDGRQAASRYNANGVDLNRDYGYMWSQYSQPFSQPETQVIREHALDNNFVLSLSFHCSGDIVNYIWNYKGQPVPDNDVVVNLSQLYGSYNGYWVVEGYDWYQTRGDTNDFSYGCRGDIDWTIEVQTSNIPGAWDLNREGMLDIIDAAGMGVSGIVTDANTGLPIEATIWVEEVFWPCFTDPKVGDYHRILFPGDYTFHFQANGYEEKIFNVSIIDSSTPVTLNVELEKNSENYYAYQITSCKFYDPYGYPNNFINNPSEAISALGPPDGINASLGEGGQIVLDLGLYGDMTDIEGYDFTVFEGDTNPDEYSVEISENWNGPWIFIGNGHGTTDFDINGSGLESAGYIRIKDVYDGDPYDIYPGFDLDAVKILRNQNNFYVDDDFTDSTSGWNSTHFNKIQDGIDAVLENGTVYVNSGVYYENLVVNKTITLIGENHNTTIIDGSSNGDVVTIFSDGVKLEGFKIINGTDCGVNISYCNDCIIQNNIINAKSPGWGTQGIRIYYGSNNTIKNNNFINNYQGLIVAYSSSNLIYHNNFFNTDYQSAYDNTDNNFWDNGHPIGGNYWDDFDEPIEGAYDNNTDGIIDGPYLISGGLNQDSYPMINPLIFIELYKGWNLITTPRNTTMTMASHIAENITNCLTVNMWDAANETYKPYIVGGPPDFDFPVNPGIGLFVEVSENSIFAATGIEVIGVSIDLFVPWNLIGWYHTYDTTAISLSENITGCLTVNSWDSVNQTYKPYIVGGPPDFDFPIYAGMGLFVEVDTVSTWNGEG